MNVSFVVAADNAGGIGYQGELPWKPIRDDMKHFRRITVGNNTNIVIMGRATYESIPRKHRPLKNRINIVLTKNNTLNDEPGIIIAESIDVAIGITQTIKQKFEHIFVIGGSLLSMNSSCPIVILYI